MPGDESFLGLAGDALAVSLSHRFGLEVRRDTMLDVRETPTGLVQLVLDLLDTRPASRVWVPLRPGPLGGRMEVDGRPGGPSTVAVDLYRFHSIEQLVMRGGRDGG